MIELDALAWISLVSSIASLVLSVLAIWLSLAFRRDADKVNEATVKLLVEIRSDAKAISGFAAEELRAYGASMRGVVAGNRPQQMRPADTTPGDFQFSDQRQA